MNKRGSHVGMVLSFVIFVTFLVFLYTTFNPVVGSQESKQYTLDSIKSNLLENIEANRTTYTISLDQERDGRNIRLNDFKDLLSENYFVFESNNTILTYEWSGVKSVDLDKPNSSLIKVYYAEGINSSEGEVEGGCQPFNEGDYSLISTKIQNYNFESKIINYTESYNLDYDALKSELRIPDDTEFSFSFFYENGTNVSVGDYGYNVNIYVDDIPLIYLDSNANIKSGRLVIRIW